MTNLGYHWVLINEHIDFEMFKETILKFYGRKAAEANPGIGRHSYDVVVRVKYYSFKGSII